MKQLREFRPMRAIQSLVFSLRFKNQSQSARQTAGKTGQLGRHSKLHGQAQEYRMSKSNIPPTAVIPGFQLLVVLLQVPVVITGQFPTLLPRNVN